jgi:large subunit ribosomal protein L9
MDASLLTDEPAKGLKTKKSVAVALVLGLATGALAAVAVQRSGATAPPSASGTELLNVALPKLQPSSAGARLVKGAPAGQRLSVIAPMTKKKTDVVLLKDAEQGKAGEIKTVAVGYARNFLYPRRIAEPVSEELLQKIADEAKKEEEAKAALKKKAQGLQQALATIGKFTIKKKVGEEDKIFGSVTKADVVEAIKMQTSQELDKNAITLPDDMSKLGTYDASVQLHPEVVGLFKVVVAKDTSG